jgi:hypothetical protein
MFSCVAPPGSNTPYHRTRGIANKIFKKSLVKKKAFRFAITLIHAIETTREKAKYVENRCGS